MERVLELKEPLGKITSSSNIFDKIKKVKVDYLQENFIVFYLDTKNKLISSEVLFKGGLNSVLIDPKTIFRNALKKNANSLIVAHNHPSGNLNPSEEDKEIFSTLKAIGKIISLTVLDSIIFNKKQYYSLN